jgi:sugar O-acyltransferase (sialic acid O-acetyltransferase NeuD family)
MILYGASGHGKVIAEILEATGETGLIFVDDKPSEKSFLGFPLSQASLLAKLPSDLVIISVGNNRIREKIARKLSVGFGLAVHPSAIISRRSQLQEGTVVMAGVIVNSSCTIGRHVILNTSCSVDHDCMLGDYVHLSPKVALAGNVRVGEGTHLGIGCQVIQGIRIGKWATIGAGATIIADVPDYAVVVGVPGKIIKYNLPDEKNKHA